MGCVDHIVELYGIRRLIADIDNGRHFGGADDHLISAALGWVAGEGFFDFFGKHIDEWRWESVSEFRQRHFSLALKRIGMG